MNPPVGSPHGDCYSASERGWMVWTQSVRAQLLGPILYCLTRLSISPDQVTLVSLLLGIGFAPPWLLGLRWWGLALLLGHVLLDGLDGPLARYQHRASHRGSFTDSFCDQIVVGTVTITLMLGAQPLVSILAGSLFLLLYTAVLAMAMVRNSLTIPYSWLVRPRFFLYGAIAIELSGVPGGTQLVIWLSNLLLGMKTVSGFFNLRQAIRGPESEC
jgi:phosphatidylglycerophosphate synthase